MWIFAHDVNKVHFRTFYVCLDVDKNDTIFIVILIELDEKNLNYFKCIKY